MKHFQLFFALHLTTGFLYNYFACGFGLSRPQFVKHQLSESMKITWQVMLIFKKGQLPT